MRNRVAVMTLWLAAVLAWPCLAQDVPAELNDERIKALIAQLGDNAFDKRKAAEVALAAAGAKAEAQLKAALGSDDAEVKQAAGRLLTRIKFAALPPADYFSVLPPNPMMSIHATGIARTEERFGTTALGKLIANPAFDDLRKKYNEWVTSDEDGKQFKTWRDRLKGQAAAGVWEFNFLNPGGVRAGVFMEVTGPDQTAARDELAAALKLGDAPMAHKDVEVVGRPNGMGALAMAGPHLFLTTSEELAQQCIDNLLEPDGMRKTPQFERLGAEMTTDVDFLFYYNVQAYLDMLAGFPMAMPGFDDIIDSSGMRQLDLMAWATRIKDGTFEERMVYLLRAGADPNVPNLTTAWMHVPPEARTEETLAALPADTVFAQCLWMDLARLRKPLLQYILGVRQMEKMRNREAKVPETVEALEKELAQAAGLDSLAVLDSIKGEAVVWVAPAPNDPLPDFGAMLTCADEKGAAEFASRLAALLKNHPEFKESGLTFSEQSYNNRNLYQIGLPKDGMPVPYSLCWTADGRVLRFASSAEALKRNLNAVDQKLPGLGTKPVFQKAMALLTPEERKGGLIFLDSERVLTVGWTALNAFLVLAGDLPEEVQTVIGKLPKPEELFKDFGPTAGAITSGKDRYGFVIRGSMPIMPTAMSAGVGVGLLGSRGRPARRAVPEQPVQEQAVPAPEEKKADEAQPAPEEKKADEAQPAPDNEKGF